MITIKDEALEPFHITINFHGATSWQDKIKLVENQSLDKVLGDIAQRKVAMLEGDMTLSEFAVKTKEIYSKIEKASEVQQVQK